MRRTRLKPGRRKPRPSLQGFWEAVTDHGTAPCALAHLGGCYGPLDAHHWLEQRTIRSQYATRIYSWVSTGEEQNALAAERDRALADPRNGVSVCRFHHDAITNARVVCPRPPDLDSFLADFGLIERERAA